MAIVEMKKVFIIGMEREQEDILRQRMDHFRQLVLWNKDKWPHEYDWYVRMGWISG